LLGPKPLERQFWFEPSNIADWLDTPTDADFVSELGVGAGREGMMVAEAWHNTGSSHFSSTARVSSAFIRPATGASLMRALQTIDDPNGYKLPDEGDGFEIDEPPYRLLGWLNGGSWASGIDTKDPLCRTISGVRIRPGRKMLKSLVEGAFDAGSVVWRVADESVQFEYISWSDKHEGENPDGRRHSLESEGHRLWVSTEILQDQMRETGMEVIVSIKFDREEGDGGYEEYGNKKRSERRTKIILLRENGDIEDCTGCIGTWQTSRSRDEAR
jgi:hypothetical protein